MGVYHKVVCDKRREKISPGDIDDLSMKFPTVACPDHPLGSVLVYAMGTYWAGESVRLVDDLGYDDEAYYDYADVTAAVLQKYNEEFRTAYRCTADDLD